MNDNCNLASIIVPAYNHEKYVGQCIESIINQTYNNIELIILNDGSKDNTSNIINEYKEKCDKRFKKFIFIDKENEGICKTLNRGIRQSSGKYLCFLASDDMIMPNKIEEQIKYMKANEEIKQLVCNGYIFYEDTYEKELIYKDMPQWLECTNMEVFKKLLYGNFLNPFSMYNREIFDKIGYFNEKLNFEDWEMYLRIAHNFKIGYIHNPLFMYRRHGNNITSKTEKSVYFMYEGTKQTINSILRMYDISFFEKRLVYANLYILNAPTFKGVSNKMYFKCLLKSFEYLPFNKYAIKYILKMLLIKILGEDRFEKLNAFRKNIG